MAQFGNVVGQQIPSNQRLWDLLVARAKHRFNTYPSPAASHWVHQEYVKAGGQFAKSRKEMKREDRQRLIDKRKKQEHKKDGKSRRPDKED